MFSNGFWWIVNVRDTLPGVAMVRPPRTPFGARVRDQGDTMFPKRTRRDGF
jgi:hypothetical protein